MILVWLEWNIRSFRLDEASFACLKRLASPGARIVRVRSERAFLRALPQAEVVLTWNFRSEWYARSPLLRVVATPAAGREFIAQDAPSGVRIHHGHFHGVLMAETVVALMYAWCRGIVAAERLAASGARGEADASASASVREAHMESTSAGNRDSALWPRRALSDRCYSLAGTSAVIVGHGHVGRAVGRLLRANGVAVKGIRRCNLAELDGALATADWVILALPSDTGTDDLIDARRLRLMPRRAVLVNVGRGNAVDERALVASLRRRAIAAALLDVFKEEPLSPSSPLAVDLPNLVRLPHASAFSPRYLPLFFEELHREHVI